jgi:hypothetical protein
MTTNTTRPSIPSDVVIICNYLPREGSEEYTNVAPLLRHHLFYNQGTAMSIGDASFAEMEVLVKSAFMKFLQMRLTLNDTKPIREAACEMLDELSNELHKVCAKGESPFKHMLALWGNKVWETNMLWCMLVWLIEKNGWRAADTDDFGYSGFSTKPGGRPHPDYHTCASCGLDWVAMKKCQRCKRVRYCSKECQAKHWKEHKNECQKC